MILNWKRTTAIKALNDLNINFPFNIKEAEERTREKRYPNQYFKLPCSNFMANNSIPFLLFTNIGKKSVNWSWRKYVENKFLFARNREILMKKIADILLQSTEMSAECLMKLRGLIHCDANQESA